MDKNLKGDIPDDDTGAELVRELGLGAAMSIGIGTMVCAGIFVLPGIAQPRLDLSWCSRLPSVALWLS